MKSEVIELSLKNKFEALFESNREKLCRDDTPALSQIRLKAFEQFRVLGFPDQSLEDWRNTNLSDALSKSYQMYFEPTFDKNVNIDHIFKCDIPDFNTEKLPQLNGWFVSKDARLKNLPNGMIYGSFAEAKKTFPELVEQYYAKNPELLNNGLNALNTAFAQDGIFIYIPDNVRVDKPVQMVSIINLNESIFVQIRNLIILGKNSSLTLVHCDDSIDQRVSFTNSLTEIYMGANSIIDHYKLQNKNNKSTLINSIYFKQEANSRVTSNAITLNGGIIRNDTHVHLDGEGCEANIFGLYLVDKDQHVDNQVYIDHAKPNSYSNELFKGILDDYASAVFNGHVLVRRNAQKTNASQSNKNILLTDKAKINTKPFLEIYADDVKCSHGATVGQLDADAMFYIRSRGISEESARLLLMYAFAAEVINKISIEALKIRIDDMVKKRLRGELSICEQCVLHCSQMEKPVVFEIDLSKI